MWQIRVEVPHDHGDGRVGQRACTVRGSRRDAERRAVSFLREVQAEGRRARATPRTVAECLEEWLATAVGPRLRPGTATHYRTCANRLIPHLGEIRLDRLKPLDIERAYAALAPVVAGSTLAATHRVLGIALRWAVGLELIPASPLARVSAPKAGEGRRQALTEEQARVLLRAALVHPQRVRLVLGLGLGMRAGEVMGLQWPDLDLEALAHGRPCLVVISRSLCGRSLQYGPTKTGKTRRLVIPEVVAAVLREELARQWERRQREPGWNPDNLIACGPCGRPTHNNLAMVCRKLCRACGLPEVVYHGLRHTIASLRLEAGENPAQVADELGHDRAELLRTYAHVTEAALVEGAKRVDRVLRG